MSPVCICSNFRKPVHAGGTWAAGVRKTLIAGGRIDAITIATRSPESQLDGVGVNAENAAVSIDAFKQDAPKMGGVVIRRVHFELKTNDMEHNDGHCEPTKLFVGASGGRFLSLPIVSSPSSPT